MPRSLSSDLIGQKNSSTNKPILLYEIHTDPGGTYGDVQGEWTYYAQYHEDVTFNSNTYTRFPLMHDGLTVNSNGQIDEVQVRISNVTREIEALIQNRNHLIGNTVIIKIVFADYLDDPTNFINYKFNIDSISSNAQEVVFTLRSELDVLQVSLPRRKFLPQCQHIYKGRGCWLDNGDGTFSQPTGFETDKQYFWTYGNEYENGGIAIGIGVNWIPVRLPGLVLANDNFVYTIKANLESHISGQNYAIKLSSSANGSSDYIQYNGTNLQNDLAGDDTYTTLVIPLADFVASPTNMDLANIRRFEFSMPTTNDSAASITIKDAGIQVTSAAKHYTQPVDSCDKTRFDCRRHNNLTRFGGFPNIPKNLRYGR